MNLKMKNKNHLIIDCSSLIYSAYFTMGNLSYNNERTGVIFGFLKKVLKLAKDFDTNKFYFCWDHGQNKRKEVYPKYKANRHKNWSEQEKIEFDLMHKQGEELYIMTLPGIGFKNSFQQTGYEADDLMAVIASRLHDQNRKAIMITSDADMYQCLDKCDIVNPSTMKRMTAKILLEEYRVTPNQWCICKSLGGCSGDNVIGIVGIADPKKKTSKALKYICGELKKGKIYERIESEEGQKIIERNISIVTLPFKPEEMQQIIFRRDKITKEKLINTFGKYRFRSMLEDDQLKEWERMFCVR